MLITPTFSALEKALDAASMRQKAINNNIANVNTPYYKAQSVTFESELQKALQQSPTSFTAYRTDQRHLSFGMPDFNMVQPRLKVDSSVGPMQNSSNNVDLDYEMTSLARNQLWYNALAQQAGGNFAKLRMVIGGK